jgi:hypothetical protein
MDTTPTLAGFQAFITNVMGINATYLPPSSQVVSDAYQYATEIVNTQLSTVSGLVYTQALYNLGGDYIANFAPDQTGQTYFATLRTKLNIAGFVGGVVSSSGDEGTNESLIAPEDMKELTFANLQQLKTPWGRAYMAYVRSYGKNVWGMS